MKKGLLTLAVISIVTLSAAALFSHGYGRGGGYGPGNCYGPGNGRGPGYGMRPGMGRYGFFKEQMGLTEKQVEKIFRIGTEYREKYFKNRENRTKILELRVEHRKAVEKVLTKEQKEKFNNLRGGRRYGRGPGGGYGNCWN